MNEFLSGNAAVDAEGDIRHPQDLEGNEYDWPAAREDTEREPSLREQIGYLSESAQTLVTAYLEEAAVLERRKQRPNVSRLRVKLWQSAARLRLHNDITDTDIEGIRFVLGSSEPAETHPRHHEAVPEPYVDGKTAAAGPDR